LRESKKLFETNGFQFILQHFKGTFDNKEYPRDYTSDQKSLIDELTSQSYLNPKDDQGKRDQEVYRLANESTKEFAERPITSRRDSVDDKSASPDSGKMLCLMGALYAKVEPDGLVTRCCHKDSGELGNIFDREFRLWDEARPCHVPVCPAGEPCGWDFRKTDGNCYGILGHIEGGIKMFYCKRKSI